MWKAVGDLTGSKRPNEARYPHFHMYVVRTDLASVHSFSPPRTSRCFQTHSRKTDIATPTSNKQANMADTIEQDAEQAATATAFPLSDESALEVIIPGEITLDSQQPTDASVEVSQDPIQPWTRQENLRRPDQRRTRESCILLPRVDVPIPFSAFPALQQQRHVSPRSFLATSTSHPTAHQELCAFYD